jgi:DMSO/TMAO reductase YedYZ heme-binding membrane subunit
MSQATLLGTPTPSAVYLCNMEYINGDAMGVLRASWQWKALNAAGLLIAAGFLTGWSTNWRMPLRADPVLEAGKWAVRFLLISLAMSPLNTYLGWRRAVSLRKSAGLWAFAFAVLHFVLSITDTNTKFGGIGWFTSFPIADFIVLGLAGLLILSILAVTSNRWAMKRLGKTWKRLHRLVYAQSYRRGSALSCHHDSLVGRAHTIRSRTTQAPDAVTSIARTTASTQRCIVEIVCKSGSLFLLPDNLNEILWPHDLNAQIFPHWQHMGFIAADNVGGVGFYSTGKEIVVLRVGGDIGGCCA